MRLNGLVLGIYLLVFLGRNFANEDVLPKDYGWLWSESWQEVVIPPYARAPFAVEVLDASAVEQLVFLGERISHFRRRGELSLIRGMWNQDVMVEQLNTLLVLTEEELLALSAQFSTEYWQSQSAEFMAIVLPAVMREFGLSDLANEQIWFPNRWLVQSFESEEELEEAYAQALKWQRILASEGEVLADFFHDAAQAMLPMMSASLLYYWLYLPDGVWPIYSRLDAIRMLYTLHAGFYDAITLLSMEYLTAYQGYLETLPWSNAQGYSLLLADNWQALLGLFYDQEAYPPYVKERNHLMFDDDVQRIEAYQHLLKASYLWLLASTEEKRSAEARYRQDVLGED
ncbi:hypothetical protein [Entomospira culicis]|uniref:Uncharacterized protein n=1 Tax=Entomospira culicis TaxID=2719989 RepID=A0A968KWE9_9SPIO|nr:hypothetical protein [Entomospira culicis]NIZ19957.1 hypothetical protein [Entomospira culicis]NIZ70178.1 hypothetical protein [Entomospira culicis]WDI38011.1 hypothetical protein PVA46_08155 [Entomospira culicis]WDI39634.1 hypothetical protein PVA47_08155 [Entomospira culicis]